MFFWFLIHLTLSFQSHAAPETDPAPTSLNSCALHTDPDLREAAVKNTERAALTDLDQSLHRQGIPANERKWRVKLAMMIGVNILVTTGVMVGIPDSLVVLKTALVSTWQSITTYYIMAYGAPAIELFVSKHRLRSYQSSQDATAALSDLDDLYPSTQGKITLNAQMIRNTIQQMNIYADPHLKRARRCYDAGDLDQAVEAVLVIHKSLKDAYPEIPLSQRFIQVEVRMALGRKMLGDERVRKRLEGHAVINDWFL